MKNLIAFVLFIGSATSSLVAVSQSKLPAIRHLRVTILSTMLADQGIGEWGFSALIEADSLKFLFDTGARDNTVIQNAGELNQDLSKVPTVILSHNHDDHTTGWIPLRKAFAGSRGTFSVTHVAPGFFDRRISPNGSDNDERYKDSIEYIGSGGRIILHRKFQEIAPGIFLTGVVPRKFPEKNYSTAGKKRDLKGNIIEDVIPEDMSLVIRTGKGLVLISGCGHSGIINTINHVRNNLPQEPVIAAIGGFHLFQNTDEQVKWTAEKLNASGVRYFMGAHCTGIEAVYQIRNWANLKRGECVVGSVGATFDSDKGFNAGRLAR